MAYGRGAVDEKAARASSDSFSRKHCGLIKSHQGTRPPMAAKKKASKKKATKKTSSKKASSKKATKKKMSNKKAAKKKTTKKKVTTKKAAKKKTAAKKDTRDIKVRKKKVASQKQPPASAKAGSGIVYADVLRETLAKRFAKN
jgi:ParB-like chromosome segregation protein Spo0J